MKVYVVYDVETSTILRCFITRKAVEKYCVSYCKDFHRYLSFVDVDVDSSDLEGVFCSIKDLIK